MELYRMDTDGLHSVPVLKETNKTYIVERCRGSHFSSRIEKGYTDLRLTKKEAITDFIKRKLNNQQVLAKSIEENGEQIKRAYDLLEKEA